MSKEYGGIQELLFAIVVWGYPCFDKIGTLRTVGIFMSILGTLETFRLWFQAYWGDWGHSDFAYIGTLGTLGILGTLGLLPEPNEKNHPVQ